MIRDLEVLKEETIMQAPGIMNYSYTFSLEGEEEKRYMGFFDQNKNRNTLSFISHYTDGELSFFDFTKEEMEEVVKEILQLPEYRLRNITQPYTIRCGRV